MIHATFQFLFNGQLDGKPFEKSFKNEQEKVIWLRNTLDDLRRAPYPGIRTVQQIGDGFVKCGHCHGTGKVAR